MKTIYKFQLYVMDEVTIPMQPGAEILTVREQDGQLALWAIVDPDRPATEMRRFRVVGTGNPMHAFQPTWRYIGTIQQATAFGEMVWHVFEVT